MKTGKYYILGRSGAGSLIVEFLLKEVGADYDISFGTSDDMTANDVNKYHPSGKIPVLICPNGNPVFETLAIVNHITDRFASLVPKKGTTLNDRYWQFLSLLATSIYPAYHRQHHSHYYISEEGYENLQHRARKEQAKIYDYIEGQLSPFICKDLLTAVDFYLYMLTRWDLNKDNLYNGRPNLKHLTDEIRNRSTVKAVLDGQPRRKRR